MSRFTTIVDVGDPRLRGQANRKQTASRPRSQASERERRAQLPPARGFHLLESSLMQAAASSAVSGIPVARRVSGFTYAIRNIVAEAKKVEAAGKVVKYLNIGDPIPFGFRTPQHLVEAVERAMRDGHNGYTPSPGIAPAREAVARDFTERGMPITADRVLLTSGTSEGIELAIGALVDA